MKAMKGLPVIQADDLSFRRAGEPVFARVSFSVYAGDFVAILGANGAGKSTLLSLVLGELTPETGTVRLFNREARRFRDWGQIGFLAQDAPAEAAAFPATAEEIVRANLYARTGWGRAPRAADRAGAGAALEAVGMAEYGRRLIGHLSGGQRQRVMLARALAGEPALLLLDEPTAGVDEASVTGLFQLLTRRNRESGLTVVMVTHDAERAAACASRVLCLENGSLLELDKTQLEEELRHRHRHPAGGFL
ncbi:MAG: metal ABC transporter ATP-binding protein [Gracilibacteraceae bacterium]|jgi:zinc transport system ATP-binding protein|nr:metal ABC transporter ATP-binding protein [Gracilibacteraceae bacterium]